jgi:hypothetical protein
MTENINLRPSECDSRSEAGAVIVNSSWCGEQLKNTSKLFLSRKTQRRLQSKNRILATLVFCSGTLFSGT